MNVQTETAIIYVLRLTEQELADALVEPGTLQDQLRAARAAHRANGDTRKNNITLTTFDEQVLAASKKQSERVKAKRFLAKTGAGAFQCDQCPKTFKKQQFLNIHKSRMHKNGHSPARSTTTTDLRRHGNTFPVSVADVESDTP